MTPPRTASIRPAATLLVLRDGPGGMELLMLRRAERAGDRMSGACVFPGGVVDEADRELQSLVRDADDAAMSARLGVESGGLDFAIAAIRECFEECGLVFATDELGTPVEPPASSDRDFAQACRTHGWHPAVDSLHYFDHWLTPAGLPKRFDTRFFAAIAPPGQTARADGSETVDQLWICPADALDPDRGLTLMQITRHQLKWAARFATTADCIADIAARTDIRRQNPRIATGRAGKRTILPHEPAWAEIGRLDPEGRHDASHEIVPGVPVRLSPHVIRLTAPNPGMMTGPGTNSYLVGGGEVNEWAVIDPGPDDPAHVAALIAAAPGPIRLILVTHTHSDHSPAAARLREATGAPVLGRLPAHPDRQDATFRPDREPQDGETIAIGGITLGVIHTPGHASNHLCYRLDSEKLLFTGDHVMQGSTVVINPPDGDMAAYLRSLSALADEDLDWLAPGHGFLIGDPPAALRALIAHRLKREAKVRAAIDPSSRMPLDALVARVYDDVAPRLHGVARRSLLAHLLKLQSDGEVDETADGWGFTSTRIHR